MNYTFSGKKVLVTGGGRGIGRQIIQRLHDDGAIVYTLEKDADLVAQLKQELPKVTAVQVDLLDWKATQDTIAQLGAMDHLVNNAGVLVSQEFMDITESAADLHLGVNFKALIAVTQAVAKGMIEAGKAGTIVNISSLAGHLTVVGLGMYSCTKAAIQMLTKSMAIELGKHNIRANSVSPTGAMTEMVKLLPPAAGDAIGRAVWPKPIDPNDIADSVLFLLSPLSNMMTGSDLLIDAGVRCC